MRSDRRSTVVAVVSQKVVKVGVVGCGVVATAYYLPYLMKMKTAEITAVCDLDKVRASECQRIFGAKQVFVDYYEMLKSSDIECVFILTGPGSHVAFALAAVAAGKHLLIQKPMATCIEDANKITEAVRAAGVKCLVEPSSNSPLDPVYQRIRALVQRGVLGDPYWFSLVPSGPDHYHPSLGGNPYGVGAFYAKDSGGYLFDYPYAPSQIVSVLGNCKSVSGVATISVPERYIVGENKYDEFLSRVVDPDAANYWDVVLDEPRTVKTMMEAPDNVFSLYEMSDGWTGVFHAGRLFHPVPRGYRGGGLEVYGTEGNLIFGGQYEASLISTRKDLLPTTDEDGWYTIPHRGDGSKAKWPQPAPGGFNYYHVSTQHIVDCILEDRDPVVNVEWGRHITEMMYGAIESSRTGARYNMTTTTVGMVTEKSRVS